MLKRSNLVFSTKFQLSSLSVWPTFTRTSIQFSCLHARTITTERRPRVRYSHQSTFLHQRSLNSQYIQIQLRYTRQLARMAARKLDRDILPDTIKPINYDISIYDLELGGDFSYQGTVSILSKVAKSTKELILNSHQLKIHNVQVFVEHTKTEQQFASTDIVYDAPRQRATITFAEDLPVSEKALIVIKFQGTMNNDMAGFCMYPPQTSSNPKHQLESSQPNHIKRMLM